MLISLYKERGIKMPNRLKQLRKEKGLTLDEIQNKTGIKRGTYNNYENGVTEPKLEAWQKLADFFGVSVPYLQGISSVKDAEAFENIQNFINSVTKMPDEYSIETNELLAFYRENDRNVFNLLGNILLKLTRHEKTNETLKKAIKEISENSDIEDISEINAIMFDVFVIMIQSKMNVKESIKARKEIVDIIEKYRSLERKDI